MANLEERGRNLTFDPETRQRITGLIRQRGARRTQEVAPEAISVGTLLKTAQEQGARLNSGALPASDPACDPGDSGPHA